MLAEILRVCTLVWVIWCITVQVLVADTDSEFWNDVNDVESVSYSERKDFADLDNASYLLAMYNEQHMNNNNLTFEGFMNEMQTIGYSAQQLVAIPEPRFYGIFLGLVSIGSVFYFRNRKR